MTYILQNISIAAGQKLLIDNFSTTFSPGQIIGLVGANGAGKTSLLNYLHDHARNLFNTKVVLVEQLINAPVKNGGACRLEKLEQAILENLDILLLDEPTNHLDRRSKNHFFRIIKHFSGSIIIASHDEELLNQMNLLWILDQKKIFVFRGRYDDYKKQQILQLNSIHEQIHDLNRAKKATHEALMKEQERSSKSKARGQKNILNRKWPTVTSFAKAGRAQETHCKKRSLLQNKKQDLCDSLNNIALAPTITPHFLLPYQQINQTILSIHDGSIGYDYPLKDKLFLNVQWGDKIHLKGSNGSGKSTFLKAILNDDLQLSGDWQTPQSSDIGYLDQHYKNVDSEKTVFEFLQSKTSWTTQEIRHHLSDFLFCSNDDVFKKITHLSGGERARLSLCLIAAHPPKLLLLDEITNNLDLITKNHVISLLKKYPSSMIFVSHDDSFVKELDITQEIDFDDREKK